MIAAVAVALAAVIVLLVTLARARRRIAGLERERGEFRDALLRLGQVIGTTDDEGAVVEIVLDVAATMVKADAAVYWRNFGAFLVGRHGWGAPTAVDRRVEHGDGLVGSVADVSRPAAWPPSTVPPGAAEPAATTAIAVPVPSGERLHGVLALYRTGATRPFTPADLEAVAEVGRQAGAGIRAVALHEEARRHSLTDGLTGVWNRRRFDLAVGEEIERSARFGDGFALVLVDIDDFKMINDTHGHPVGDGVLVELSSRLMAETREVDLVARLGGEEFVLLLPRTDLAGALAVAEKLRADVAAAPVFTSAAGALDVTLSAGVAAYPEHGPGLSDLLVAADVALYQAKAAGKNCVRPAPGPAEIRP